jgi:hypothetical protein
MIARSLRLLPGIGLALLLLSPAALRAQWLDAVGAADERVVIVGLVEELEIPDASALVIRRPVQQPRDVILVTPGTRPPDLAKAFAMLRRSRLHQGTTVEQELRAPITPALSAPRDGRTVAAAAELLRALRTAEAAEIDGIGTLPVVPAITVLPEAGS